MFEHSEVWRSLCYRERLIATILIVELAEAGGVKYIESDRVKKEACMSKHDFIHYSELLFKKGLLDVDDSGKSLCLKGDLEKLFETAVLHRRGR